MKDLAETIKIINQLVVDGIINDYAIGGVIAATHYDEAVFTEDLDIFVALKVTEAMLISPAPVYKALTQQGFVEQKEHIVIYGWPVQILVAYNPLVEEAVQQSAKTSYDGTPTRVFTAEHICAIAVQTGRSKDRLRLEQFVDKQLVNVSALLAICKRYDLENKLEAWQPRLHQSSPIKRR